MVSNGRERNKYSVPAIRQLRDHLATTVPHDQLLPYADRAEDLVGELEVNSPYSFEYLHHRLMGRRPDAEGDLKIVGSDARHDMQLIVQDMSELSGVRAEDASQPVLTVHELAKALNVSVKTISRWRLAGLVSRRFVFDDRKQVGFLQSSVDRFTAQNRDRVRRGACFSQTTAAERDSILQGARRLAAEGGRPAHMIKQLSQMTGRSVETIRCTLKRFDREHPDVAIFPHRHSSLPLDVKRKIHQAFLQGESVGCLADRFRQNKEGIHHILAEMRARRILDLPLEYMPHEQFEGWEADKNAEKEILGAMPESAKPMNRPPSFVGLSPYVVSLYDVPLLTREQEVHLFRKLNFLKFKASRLRNELSLSRPTKGLMAHIEQLYEEIVHTKNYLIRANLRLVVSIANRYITPDHELFELVSDGNISLIQAVERFDFARQIKFSSYATSAIRNNLMRTTSRDLRRRTRFRTSRPDVFAVAEDVRSGQQELEAIQAKRERMIDRILQQLNKREQEIITYRFGLRCKREPLTLKQVGAVMGVTKERIRQIETQALDKLRVAANVSRAEIP